MTSLLAAYLLCAVATWIYSYGFVDFNLTLSSHPLVVGFVEWAQQLAMFHRSHSLSVYLTIIASLSSVYALSVMRARRFSRFPWLGVGVGAVIFALAYTFLSSDVFKYLFAARMVIDYHVNPHVLPPNTFPDDTWIRFMRWVHTPSPYGPGMTLLSLIAYLGGLKKFVPALYISKIIAVGFYLWAIKLVGKLTGVVTTDKKTIIQSQLFFALNPLILIEWLTNVHNDGPMITLFLASLYLLTMGKKAAALGMLAISASIKYVTGILLPFIVIPRPFDLRRILNVCMVGFALAPIMYHYSYQYQPWYVTWLIPLAAIAGSGEVMAVVGAYSLGALLRYVPFIATGVWQGTPAQFALLTFVSPLIAIVVVAVRRLLIHSSRTNASAPHIIK